jgi:porin
VKIRARGYISRLLVGSAAALALGGATAVWAEPASEPGWLERPHLTGGWDGRREALAERGIVPGARYTAGFWSNVRGGFQTGTRYEGFAQWWVEADLDALAGWQGGSFDINWYSYHGGQPSLDLVGPFPTQTISGWEAAESVRFYEILLRQTWGEGRFVLKAGQLAADTDFFVSENAEALLNGTFGFLGLGRATEIAPFYPLAAPGAYFRARTADSRWEAHVGVYTADTGVDESSNFGFDWSFDNGAFFIGELRTRRSPFGRPGIYSVGAIGTTAELEDFASGGTANGGYGLFASVDQLLIEQTPDRPGLGVFVRSYGAPQEERTLALWYVDLGLKLTRPFRSRARDVLSLGFAHLRLSDDYVASLRAGGENVSRRASVLELTYRFQVTGWLTLQPDVQFFFDPHFSRRDATVIGLRAVVEL